MEEIWKFWKEVKCSNQFFKKGDILTVSDWGRVKCNREFYKCTISSNGYYYLCHTPLHRIIAEKFLTDWNPNKEVDHINTVKTDNRTCNLCMVDHTQNQKNPLSIQHQKESQLTKPVLQYTLDNKLVNEFISVREAERQMKIYHGSIIKCCKHKLKSTGGYIWRYKKED